MRKQFGKGFLIVLEKCLISHQDDDMAQYYKILRMQCKYSTCLYLLSIYPIGSMIGMFYVQFMVNVGTYFIHGASGHHESNSFPSNFLLFVLTSDKRTKQSQDVPVPATSSDTVASKMMPGASWGLSCC